MTFISYYAVCDIIPVDCSCVVCYSQKMDFRPMCFYTMSVILCIVMTLCIMLPRQLQAAPSVGAAKRAAWEGNVYDNDYYNNFVKSAGK